MCKPAKEQINRWCDEIDTCCGRIKSLASVIGDDAAGGRSDTCARAIDFAHLIDQESAVIMDISSRIHMEGSDA